MEHLIITIARQYGSGGKTIGNMLAEEMGIKAYNREILRLASDESGISEAMFNEVDEKLKNNPLRGILHKEYHGELLPPEDSNFVSNQNLFNYQAKVIKELAARESCVLIGRCADYVLKDHPDVIRVFVHAPRDYCLKMAVERGACAEKDVEKYVQKIDKYRADFYHYYTGRTWNDAHNYDLCLNSEKLGFQGCVDAIRAYINVYQNCDRTK